MWYCYKEQYRWKKAKEWEAHTQLDEIKDSIQCSRGYSNQNMMRMQIQKTLCMITAIPKELQTNLWNHSNEFVTIYLMDHQKPYIYIYTYIYVCVCVHKYIYAYILSNYFFPHCIFFYNSKFNERLKEKMFMC